MRPTPVRPEERLGMARRRHGCRSAADYVPEGAGLEALREASARCRGCDLWQCGTQTVFGEGPAPARLMLVGEQPGHDEDLAGRPFVGPAGTLLERALAEAGLERSDVYVTNVVKHFKWEPRGKRRIHAKPSASQIASCLPWLEAELDIVHPRIVGCLGATAAQSLLGRQFRVTQQRGTVVPSRRGPSIVATVHPSAVLRAPDAEARRRERSRLVDDLRVMKRALGHAGTTLGKGG
jgi:uracil-DNA glycosylase family protein